MEFKDIDTWDFYCPHCEEGVNDDILEGEDLDDFLSSNGMLSMKNGEVKNVVCPNCGKGFRVKAHLEIVFETVEGE